MASCKDCLSVDVCKNRFTFGDMPIFEHFKDRNRFVYLPCDVGTEVYLPQLNDLGEIEHYPIECFVFDKDGISFVVDDEDSYTHPVSIIGKDVFLTAEEAEKALKECEKH